MGLRIHIHAGRAVVRDAVVLRRPRAVARDAAQTSAEDVEAFIEELMAAIEAERVTTHDEDAGHQFHGNQYTEVAGQGEKPTSMTGKTPRDAVRKLLSTGHNFTLDELIAATGTDKKTVLGALSKLKVAHEKGLNHGLHFAKMANGSFQLEKVLAPGAPAVSPALAQELGAVAKAATAATAAKAEEPKAPAEPALPVAKAPAEKMHPEKADEHYQQALQWANDAAGNAIADTSGMQQAAYNSVVKQQAKLWKEQKALAMAQWVANTKGVDQQPAKVEVFKEDEALVQDLALASQMKPDAKVAAQKAAIAKWKEATHKAKAAAANKPPPPTAAAKKAEPEPAKVEAKAPPAAGKPAFEAPSYDDLAPASHKHISASDFQHSDTASAPFVEGLARAYHTLGSGTHNSDPVKNKKKIEAALGKRLEASLHFSHFAAKYKEANPYASGDEGSLQARLIRAWAGSSGDSNTTSVSMQIAIRDAFSMPHDSVETKALSSLHDHDDTELHKKAANKLGMKLLAAEVPSFKRALQDFALAQYHETQDHLKKLGIKEMHLVRGMDFSSPDDKAELVNLKLQPASSFSTSISTAAQFAGGGSMFAVKVPASQIISSFLTGYGCTSESEVVVLAHKSLKAVQVPAWKAGNTIELAKQAKKDLA